MRFSVVIPVYNKANTIRASIDSVLAQINKDYEIIIVDDGSVDNLIEALSDYDNLNVIHQKNAGVSVARNTGIKNSKGDFVCFLDADDLWKDNHLSTLSMLIDKYPDVNYFVTSHIISNTDGTFVNSSDFLKDYSADFRCDDLLGLLNNTSYSVIHTNSICARRSEFINNNLFFEPGIRIGEDTDVWYRLALKNTAVVTKKLTTVYRRENSTATKFSSYIDEWIFSKRLKDIDNDPDILSEVKVSAAVLIDRYLLNSSRQNMLTKNRKQALKILKKVRYKKGKRYFLTKLFCYSPYFICSCLIK